MCNLRSIKKKLINEFCDANEGIFNKPLDFDEQKNKNNNINLGQQAKPLSAHAIWGAFIGLLRKQNLMTLHTACGEIRDVSLNGFVLEARLYDEYLYKILTKEQNFEKIVFYLRQIDDRINIQFKLVNKSTNYGLENLNKLKAMFGNELEEN